MPATEKTWRDLRSVHVIFGVSSLVMLLATLWMFERDHNREWRDWQLADRGKERWAIGARLAETSAASHGELVELQDELRMARSAGIDREHIERFNKLVQEEDDRLAEEGQIPKKNSLERLNTAYEELQPLAELAVEARQAMAAAQEEASEAMAASLAAQQEDPNREAATAAAENARQKLAVLKEAEAARNEAEAAAAEARDEVVDAMSRDISEAQRRETELTVLKKFAAAEHTAKVSEHGIAIHEGASQEQVDRLQADIDALVERIAELDAAVALAMDYRKALDSVRREVLSDEADVQKEIDAVRAELARLEANLYKNTSNLGESITRLPILDALYDGNIRIDQIWLPDMKINYNFSYVARYDRCTTCHRSIDKTAPGSAVEPAYPAIPKDERRRTVALETPSRPPQAEVNDRGQIEEPTLELVYGFVLADRGQVNREDVTIQYVVAESLAAQAGLEMGDVIEQINGGPVYSNDDVEAALLRTAAWGETLQVTIQRGLDQPFTTHPRLDLFVGSLSPHKKGEMGCTICHDGQGSATDFKWASHTPNDPDTANEWARQHGWFDNHHWIFPMTPERFIESNCLKCHHEVVDLEPSERFPEPPAPKLVKGYQLVREYGCYGCHEINGYEGPDKRIGPDLRVEPNYHEVAAALLNDQNLSDSEREWATSLIRGRADGVRQQLLQSIANDAAAAAEGETPRLDEATHELAELLKDVETPGTFRKVGPSLRYLGAKVEYEWLFDWLRQPSNFRPDTRMPQFFGLHEHLEDEEKEFPGPTGEPESATDREYTERFEAIEIRALAEYLLNESSEFTYLDPAEGVTEEPSAERGKWLFESRGCLACHSHKEFPGIASDQGPDLSRLAAKFNSGRGQRWLYTWLKEPHSYHSQTVMPDLFLDPIEEKDVQGKPTGKVTDPALDIMAFLLDVPPDWRPENVPPRELSAEDEQALADLAKVWLSAAYPKSRAERYANEGIAEDEAGNITGDERALVGMTDANRIAKQLDYVARRTISRYGCFGCHDIPGYEAAKPIGTALAEWGRKEPSKLAFENIQVFLATHGVDGKGAEPHGHDDSHHGLDPLEFDDDTGYYIQAIAGNHRQGFIWQKLRQPRSYDYEKTRNKRYDERLRMPKFPLDKDEREAVITFVLGLVNEAPAEKYIYQPGPRQEAIVQGRHVLQKYNCAGCHALDMERWEFDFEPGWFFDPPEMVDFPFLHKDVAPEKLAASLETDRRGLMHASLYGMPTYDEETGEPSVVDEDGVPLEPGDDESEPYYEFVLYRDAILQGAVREVGVQNLLVPAQRDGYGPARGQALPGWGGDLARYLFPRVIEREREVNPQFNSLEAWGYVPPPLGDEGPKVQPNWLHNFLMDPYPIRPFVVLRMPNFRMTSDEARALADYFAAKSDADFPYEYNPRRRDAYLAMAEQDHPERLQDAMTIVLDSNYCVKCHSVGDLEVFGQGPNLAQVYERLRPEWVRKWIANPKKILPYTGMPVNIPYAEEPPHFGGVRQELYPGTSIEQLDGVVDLMMNYDVFTKRRTSIQDLAPAPAEVPPTADASAPPTGGPGGG